MSQHPARPFTRPLLGLVALLWLVAAAPVLGQSPAPPSSLTATDRSWDGGEAVVLTWDVPADTGGTTGYRIERSMTAEEIERKNAEDRKKAQDTAKAEATESILGDGWESSIEELDEATRARVRAARRDAAEAAGEDFDRELGAMADGVRWTLVSVEPAGTDRLIVTELDRGESYRFRITAIGPDGATSAPAVTGEGTIPVRSFFDGSRFWFMIILVTFCGAVVLFIGIARTGRPLKIRKIAGLEAVDEAVGRATEMGRPVLFVPGIQDMNEVQTIAGITVLARVARTAAEYDAKVEVPTARSLVMTSARETIEAAYLSAGRPDAYNQDLIYYVTDEQFGYVAYLSGLQTREKPAACFYMGMFYAESLILAETGNAIGAIQVAGTAQPAQLPFFVAACDYTLIGEEFFAAPEELGSLKGQDAGKVLVAAILVIGVIMATIAELTGSEAMADAVIYLRETILA